MLELIDIKKEYGSNLVLENINFSAKQGEIVGIIGPNGAGKTTLLNIASTLLQPTEGHLHYNGHLIENSFKIRKNIGYVSHEPMLYLDFSPVENIKFFSSLFKLNYNNKNIEEILDGINLLNCKDIPVRQFSKGMLQRLAVVKALMHDPDFIFLDEPFSGLDSQATTMMQELINQLKEKGKIILLSIHDLALNYTISDKLLILFDHIIQDEIITSKITMKNAASIYQQRIMSN